MVNDSGGDQIPTPTTITTTEYSEITLQVPNLADNNNELHVTSSSSSSPIFSLNTTNNNTQRSIQGTKPTRRHRSLYLIPKQKPPTIEPIEMKLSSISHAKTIDNIIQEIKEENIYSS